jgi:hypothetical protein
MGCASEIFCSCRRIPSYHTSIAGSRESHRRPRDDFITHCAAMPGGPASGSSSVEAAQLPFPLIRVGTRPVASRGAETLDPFDPPFGRFRCGTTRAPHEACVRRHALRNADESLGRKQCHALDMPRPQIVRPVPLMAKVRIGLFALGKAACCMLLSERRSNRSLADLCSDHVN